MIAQRTLKRTIKTTGVGLHTGRQVVLTLRPAQPDTGIVFHRVDLERPVDIRADARDVERHAPVIALEGGGAKVSTVEHLMSALAGLGIDNLHVDVAGPEVPIMDGSAGPFVFLLQSAGIVEQRAPKRFFRIRRRSRCGTATSGRASSRSTASSSISRSCSRTRCSSARPSRDVDFAENSYVKEVARARTFGFMQDVEAMRNAGLALGGSLQNAIVLDEYRVLNSEGLRYDNEFVKHKVLDAIGDLYLVGHPLIGEYTAYKSGHALNNQLLRTTLDQADAWELTSYDRADQAPAGLARAFALAS